MVRVGTFNFTIDEHLKAKGDYVCRDRQSLTGM